MYVTYRKTGNPEIPAVICANGNETPVWIQGFWKTGPDAQYIRMNGCGHCCAAMAARLQGVKDIDPEIEYARCKELWGEPGGPQDHFQTVRGIVNVLKSFDVKAEAMGIPQGEWGAAETATESTEAATGPAANATANPDIELCKLKNRLEQALASGKQVIFWSHPTPGRENENPFSTGEHYVMACGYDEDGNIVIANSGNRVTGNGEQLVDMDTVMKALYYGADPVIETWGEDDRLGDCGGIVIVG